MNYFWGNVFEYFKDRRLGAVFFGTLALFIGALALGGMLYQIAGGYNLLQYWPMMLPGIGLVLLALVWRGVRQRRAQRLNRYKTSPLSRDELAKARSKLTTKPTFKSS
jgi:high-affinity Fe2+/Pb2+ permease